MTSTKELPARASSVIVLCVEPGLLEYKAVCALLSFRRYSGSWAETPIFVYSPRAGRIPSPWVLHLFEELKVTHITEPLNTEFPTYPLANKPICLADAEKRSSADTIVFLDSDTVCWQEPTEFALEQGVDLRLCPDGTKTVASAGPGDSYEPMWQALYRMADAQHEPYCTTALTGKRVRGWWSSGVIVVRRSAGILTQWKDVFLAAMRAEASFPPEANYLREQCTLCAVGAARADRFAELPITHNYPIQNWDHYTSKGSPPSTAVLWHYQPFLNKAFHRLAVRVDGSRTAQERDRVLWEFLARLRTDFAHMIGLDESWFKGLRRRLMLGIRFRSLLGLTTPQDKEVLRMSGID